MFINVVLHFCIIITQHCNYYVALQYRPHWALPFVCLSVPHSPLSQKWNLKLRRKINPIKRTCLATLGSKGQGQWGRKCKNPFLDICLPKVDKFTLKEITRMISSPFCTNYAIHCFSKNANLRLSLRLYFCYMEGCTLWKSSGHTSSCSICDHLRS